MVPTEPAMQTIAQPAAPPPVMIPHSGEIKVMEAVYVMPQAPPPPQPQVVSYAPPEPAMTQFLPPTTVVGEAVYASVQVPQPQVQMEPVATQVAPPPVYSAPVQTLPHQGEIQVAPAVYVNVQQQPVHIEPPAPVTTAVAPP